MPVTIGLDFGNFNSYLCFVQDMDTTQSRLSGRVQDLCSDPNGIPSVFFFTWDTTRIKSGLPLVGNAAITSRARPEKNRIRFLKRHLGEQLEIDGKRVVIDGKTYGYDEAIRDVVQDAVRSANTMLQRNYMTTTNKIFLAYPATYSCAQRKYLVDLVQSATVTVEGSEQKLEVVGTVAEPAAAALDYLAEFVREDKTVLTYDLGGGTFDLALVSTYINGKPNTAGKLRYYDVLATDGIPDLGGKEFTDKMYQLLLEKARQEYPELAVAPAFQDKLITAAETIKCELSTQEDADVSLLIGGDLVDLSVSRSEFEETTVALVQKTVDKTRNMLTNSYLPKPDLILMTGSASQMPMIQIALEKAFPEYQGRVIFSRPSKGVAYGAARFGAVEDNTDPVQQRTAYDIGIRFYSSIKDEIGYISTYIPSGTELPSGTEPPFRTAWNRSRKLSDQRYSRFDVCEARTKTPNRSDPDHDYRTIMSVDLDHGKVVPKGTESESRLLLDSMGILTVEAREISDGGSKIDAQCKLKDLT